MGNILKYVFCILILFTIVASSSQTNTKKKFQNSFLSIFLAEEDSMDGGSSDEINTDEEIEASDEVEEEDETALDDESADDYYEYEPFSDENASDFSDTTNASDGESDSSFSDESDENENQDDLTNVNANTNVYTNVEIENTDNTGIIITQIHNAKEETLQTIHNYTKNMTRIADGGFKNISESLLNRTKNISQNLNNMENDLNEFKRDSQDDMYTLENEISKGSISDLEFQAEYLADDIKKLKNNLHDVEEEMTKIEFELPINPDYCSLLYDCYSCLLNSACGWCRSTQTCSSGTLSGPVNSYCQKWDFKTCPGDECLQNKKCGECIENSFCGWCVDNSFEGNLCIKRTYDFHGCSLFYHSLGINNNCEEAGVSTTYSDSQLIIFEENALEDNEKILTMAEKIYYSELEDELKHLKKNQDRLLKEIIKDSTEINDLQKRIIFLNMGLHDAPPEAEEDNEEDEEEDYEEFSDIEQ